MRKIVLAGFFATILLLVPCTSAFTLPLNQDEQKELRILVQQVEDITLREQLENILDIICTDTGDLDIDRLENVLESYLQHDGDIDPEILNTNVWQWIVDRLGWVYITSEHIMTLYTKGTYIFTVFSAKYTMLVTWYQSILLLKEAWQAFKFSPTFLNLIHLITAVGDVLLSTIAIIKDIADGEKELLNALYDFQNETQAFNDFLADEPWNAPILIEGTVEGIEGTATVSCKNDTVTTNGSYTLNFTTADESKPWWVHHCVITANYEEKEKTQESYAFSMGRIEANFDFTGTQQKKQFKNNMGYPLILQFFDRLQLFLLKTYSLESSYLI